MFLIGSVAVTGARFGEGTGRIWLDSIQCTGNEREISNCSRASSNGLNFCTHTQDAGVRCQSGSYYLIFSLAMY